MSIRSYLDPCFFIVFMHIGGPNLTSNLANVVQSLRLKNFAPVNHVLNELTFRSQQTLFHEQYHFWQGLRLPFMFRYAFLAYFKVLQYFQLLAEETDDFTAWNCLIPEFERLGIEAHVGTVAPGKLYLSGDPSQIPPGATSITISPLDLLECAASIAEFQVTANGSPTDPLILRRWLKRNPAYLEPYYFVSSFLGDEALTLRMLLPMLNACFYTSDPPRTFVQLLARAWGRFVRPSSSTKLFLDQQEPCRWPEVFQSWLNEIDFEDAPDSDANILSRSYHRLTLDYWLSCKYGRDGGLAHPMLSALARHWRDLEETNPAFKWIIDQPAWISEDVLLEARRTFQPLFSFARFHASTGNDSSFWWGRVDNSTPLPGVDPEGHRGIFADTLTMYGAVRRASGAHFDGSQRTCHHIACPYYEANYCNAYPIVPPEYTTCGFPKRMQRLIAEWRPNNGDA